MLFSSEKVLQKKDKSKTHEKDYLSLYYYGLSNLNHVLCFSTYKDGKKRKKEIKIEVWFILKKIILRLFI